MDYTAYSSSIVSGNVNCYNTVNSRNNTFNVNKVIVDENLEMMRWLSPLDPQIRHQDVRTNRLDGVGNWLLETDEFRGWRSSEGGADKAVLFCYGNPGVGKTYLSSLVIDSLRDESSEEHLALAMFYCDFRDQQQQTTPNIVGAILKQLVVRGDFLEHVQVAFHKAKKEPGGRGLLLPDILRLLKGAVATLPQVFICIDAVDECVPKHLWELLGSLKDILRESPNTRIFITGRPQVEVEIRRYFPTTIIAPISPKTQDIKIYLERRLEMDTEPEAMSASLREDILRIIPERLSEIFLLVSLSIDAILGEVTISERRQMLNELIKGSHLDYVYAPTIAQIKAQSESRRTLGMEALMWVSNSERPLHTSELCHALGVEIGSTDLDADNIPTIRTILGCTLGLITVEASSSTVWLVHATLQEYLSNNPSLFQRPHSVMAEVCLTYLNFQCVRQLSPTLSSAPSAVPLVEYATYYWGKHIRREKIEGVSPLALGLLLGFEQHISSQLLFLYCHRNRHWWEPDSYERGGPNGFTGLHGAAFFGIVEIVAALLAIKIWDINATDAMGRTALAWAVIRGHEDVVKLLLERKDINPNTPDTACGLTPLLWAAERGHEGIVKLLLNRGDVNPDQAETLYGQTPLLRAAKNGHEGVVKMLLERTDVNPGSADTEYGRTPLSWAAWNGYEGVVKMLLELADVNPDLADTEYGRTPLSWAAGNGYEEVVKMLLERDVNPNSADTKYGRTPLSWAAECGHVGIVNLLSERNGVHTATPNKNQKPLRCALSKGRDGIARILQEPDNINSDTTDPGDQSSLPHSAGHEDESVVEIQSKACDPNTDITGLNPQQAFPSADPGERDRIPGPCDYVFKFPENDLSPTIPSTPLRPPSTRLPKVRHPPDKTGDQDRTLEPYSPFPLFPPYSAVPPVPLQPPFIPLPKVRHPPDKTGDEDRTLEPYNPFPLFPHFPAVPSAPPQPPSARLPKLRHPLGKTDTHPNTRPIFSLTTYRYIIIASSVCLLAILVYILPRPPQDLFPFHK